MKKIICALGVWMLFAEVGTTASLLQKDDTMIKKASMKIVCLGDSITGPAPGEVHLNKYVKFSDLVQFGLDVLYGEGAVTVLNQGKAGDPSSTVREKLEERLLVHHPDVVVILLGANNYAGKEPVEVISAKFKKDLLDIVRRAKAAKIKPILVQYAVPRAENMEKVWVHADRGNPTIAEVAKEESVPLIALRPYFDKASESQPLDTLASPIDGLHLNPGGELLVAHAIIDKLRELRWLP